MASIQPHFLDRSCFFMNQMWEPTFFVVHNTAGNTSLQNLENYWISQCGVGSNSHFGIERYSTSNSQPGDIWQWCQLYDGACANCCTETGHAPFLPSGNLNVFTASCEGINADVNNQGPTPEPVVQAWAYLIRDTCIKMGIPTNRFTSYWNGYENTHTFADASGGVIMHRDIAPQNRRMCPGDMYYDGTLDRIMSIVNGGNGQVFVPPNNNDWYIKHWQAFYEYTGNLQNCPVRDLGIFNAWKALMRDHNIDLGSVTTPEIAVGNLREQHFTAGTITWNLDDSSWHATSGAGPLQG